MVYADANGSVKPLYLKDLQDPATGKIPPRQLDVHTDEVMTYVENIMDYITPADYEAARKLVPNPEMFDLYKILNW